MNKSQTNICKGIAIIMMYVHHLFYNWETVEGFEIIWTPFEGDSVIWFAQLCKVCVAIFVFLTGYGCAKASLERNEASIAKTVFYRCWKFLCNYWFVFVIFIIAAQCMTVFGKNRTFTTVYCQEGKFHGIVYFLLDFLGIANIFGTPTFNATWWYIPYAILFICITPFLIKLINRLGMTAIVIICLCPRFLYNVNNYIIFRYLPVLIIGIYFARYELFEKLQNSIFAKNGIDVVFSILIGLFLTLLRQRMGYYDISEGGIAVVICYLVYRILTHTRVISKLLEILGKHSMNLFMMHSFFIVYYFKSEIYALKNIWIILIMSFFITYPMSMLMEWIKRKIHFPQYVKNSQKVIFEFWKNQVEG